MERKTEKEHLQVAFGEDLAADGSPVRGAERRSQVFALCKLTLAHIDEDVRRLHDLVEVRLGTAAPIVHLVFVACNFETLAVPLEANNRNVGQPLLSCTTSAEPLTVMAGDDGATKCAAKQF